VLRGLEECYALRRYVSRKNHHLVGQKGGGQWGNRKEEGVLAERVKNGKGGVRRWKQADPRERIKDFMEGERGSRT